MRREERREREFTFCLNCYSLFCCYHQSLLDDVNSAPSPFMYKCPTRCTLSQLKIEHLILDFYCNYTMHDGENLVAARSKGNLPLW